MKKYSKKIALILALALTLALAIPALAQQTDISGAYTATGTQVINVAVSGGSTVQAYLNPIGYTHNVYKTGSDTEVDYSLEPSGDITTMPIVGVNMGGSTVKVRAAVTSTQNGKFKFASSVPSQKSTSGVIWLEALGLDSSYDLGCDVDTKTNAVTFQPDKVYGILNEWKHTWIDSELYGTGNEGKAAKKVFTDAFNVLKKTNYKLNRTDTEYQPEIVILKKGTAESKQHLCTMPAATDAASKKYGYFVARLSGRIGDGDTSKGLTKAWTSNDGFGASIIWTFQTTDDAVESNLPATPSTGS